LSRKSSDSENSEIRHDALNVRIFSASIFFSAALCVAGCSRHSVLIPPISDAQSAFYEIRELHEKDRSREVLSKGDAFLKADPPEELACCVRYYLAYHFERLGRIEEAKKEYRGIVRRHPKSGWAMLAESHLRTMED